MPTHEERLSGLLVAWDDARRVDVGLTVEQFCADRGCIDLLAEFREMIACFDSIKMVEATEQTDGSSDGDEIPPVLGERFAVKRVLGRGGLGVVYLAGDAELERDVALKTMRRAAECDETARLRFIREATITGRLDHPGVVAVHDLNRKDASVYYTMRVIGGESMRDAIDRYHAHPSPTELRRLLRGFIAACETVAYAHSKGVIHRDLKPHNIMLGAFGETLVIDWGLAGHCGERDLTINDDPSGGGSLETVAGRAMGTWAYMSPEQGRGDWENVGPASDVFSLGATLYHLLNGRPAYVGENVQEDVKAGRFAPSGGPKPLAAICAKAMAVEPPQRYRDARELARDVESWLADEPVSAYRDPLMVQVRRWAKQHRTLVTTAAAVALVGTIAIVIGGARLERVNRELEKRNDDLVVALTNEKAARELADERRARIRGLLREAVAFTWWGPTVSGKGNEAATLQLRFLASQYEAAVRADGGGRDDLVFLDLVRSFGLIPLGPGEKKPDLAEVLAQLTNHAADEPDNDWVVLWRGVVQTNLGVRHLEAGRFADARRELVAARDWLAANAHRRSEGPLALGHVTNYLYLLSEESQFVQRDELLGWLTEARAALGAEPPPGSLADGLRDNWVFLGCQLAFYQQYLRSDAGNSPNSEETFRAFAAEMAAKRPTILAAAEATKVTNLEARALRFAGLLSKDIERGLRDIDRAVGILAQRLNHGANDPVFREEFGRAQVAYLFLASRLLAASREGKARALPPKQVAIIAHACVAILADATHARDRAAMFRQVFPNRTEESMRREWEKEREKAKSGM